jgi:hypothetical protein
MLPDLRYLHLSNQSCVSLISLGPSLNTELHSSGAALMTRGTVHKVSDPGFPDCLSTIDIRALLSLKVPS